MSWGEQELREAFLSSLTAANSSDAEVECPSAEEIWDAVNMQLPAARRREIISLTASCPECALAWQAAISVQQEAAAIEPAAVTNPPQPDRPSFWQQLLRPAVFGPAMAGAAALLVAVVWLDGPAPLDPLAAPAPSGVLRGAGEANVVLQKHATELTIGDTLSWSPVADAQGYEITFMDTGGNALTQVVATPSYRLGTEVAERFAGGETLTWSVSAVGSSAGGERSAPSTFEFHQP
ncbi:MAG: hypothetical protein AAGI67_19055 [Pseudomonadota bacterium]